MTAIEMPQIRIYDRNCFCGKSMVEFQKHSEIYHRFTTEKQSVVVTTDTFSVVDSVVNLS